MAQYASQAEFLNSSLPVESFSTLPAGAIDTALTWASSFANSYLRKRYNLPLTTYGEDLKSAVCDVAAWRLLKYRGFKPASGASDAVIQARDLSLSWFREISRGEAELDGAIDSSPAVDEAGTLAASDTSADFTWFVSAKPTGACLGGC